MTTMTPLPPLTVILPFRNASAHLHASLSSIAASTFGGWQCLCIDDASTDDGAAIVKGFVDADPRFSIIPACGCGIVAALNTGLAAARSPIIARMDADDLCHPHRLELQIGWLEAHPGCDLVSSRIEPIWDTPAVDRMVRYLAWVNECLSHEQIVEGLLIESPLPHPSVTYRRERVVGLGGYRAYNGPEDYDLWIRMGQAGCLFHKLPDTLLSWRMRDDSVTRTDPRCHPDRFFDRKCAYLVELLRIRQGSISEIIVWGAGRRGGKVGKLLVEAGMPVAGFIDVDSSKVGGKRQWLPVFSPEIARQPIKGRIYVGAVSSWEGRENIGRTLAGFGLRRGEDYLLL